MLQTRLWMGSLLVALGALILIEAKWLAPWFPFLFVATGLALVLGTRELLSLINPAIRPATWLCSLGVLLIVVANWSAPIDGLFATQRDPYPPNPLYPQYSLNVAGKPIIAGSTLDAWHLIIGVFTAAVIAAFLLEIARFRGPNNITQRIALTVMASAYLGLLPSFLLQMRFFPGEVDGIPRSTVAIALTVFVPKVGDIGAYFTGKFLTGRVLGRTLMTPLLSPKKTWQGFCGGLIAAVLATLAINGFAPIIPGGTLGAVGFGLTVGIAGVFGDLAESLIKRDCNTKDASRTIPGFGGILDVIDSLLFAAPVAYLWLK